MKVFGILICLTVVTGFFLYPALNEDSESACHALERRVVSSLPEPVGAGRSEEAATRAFLGALVGILSDGSIAASVVKQRHPNVPPAIGCTITYWHITLDPSVVPRLAREAGIRL